MPLIDTDQKTNFEEALEMLKKELGYYIMGQMLRKYDKKVLNITVIGPSSAQLTSVLLQT